MVLIKAIFLRILILLGFLLVISFFLPKQPIVDLNDQKTDIFSLVDNLEKVDIAQENQKSIEKLSKEYILVKFYASDFVAKEIGVDKFSEYKIFKNKKLVLRFEKKVLNNKAFYKEIFKAEDFNEEDLKNNLLHQ